jgi:2-polyprenyl-6-methoxyphenol hydroxylase-like FAD-dependent oxidoreductase
MGNAAHSLHPVAGQGFNLALRDCVALCQALLTAHQRGEALGELSVLLAYYQRQQGDQLKTVQFSDRVGELFQSQQLPLTVMCALGLVGIDAIAPIRRGFVRQAAGVAAAAATGVY